VALLSLGIVFWIDDAAGEYRNAEKNGDPAQLNSANRKLGWIGLARLRLVLMLALWFLVGGQALLYFNSLNCWFSVPANVESWAKWAYGDKLPEKHCIDGYKGAFNVTLAASGRDDYTVTTSTAGRGSGPRKSALVQ
jgi:hypothetical protein